MMLYPLCGACSIAKSLDDLTKFIDADQIPVQYNGQVGHVVSSEIWNERNIRYALGMYQRLTYQLPMPSLRHLTPISST